MTAPEAEVSAIPDADQPSKEVYPLNNVDTRGKPLLPDRRLIIFIVTVSLASLVGIVLDMGLRYGFSRPWAWTW